MSRRLTEPVVCPECGESRIVKWARYGKGDLCRTCSAKRAKPARLYEKHCEECDSSFSVNCFQRGWRKYCSIQCAKTAGNRKRRESMLRKNRLGTANPNYKSGKQVGQQFRAFRLSRKDNADYCRSCGATERLELHHAIPRSKHRAGRDEILNGLPLCRTCHMKWHHKTLTIYRNVFTTEEWGWLSSQQLTGENIEAWLDRAYPERSEEAA